MAVSPFAWRPCCLRTIQRPLAASPCGRLSRPRSTISQSDCRRAIGPFSPFRLGRPYKRSLEPNGSPLFTRNLWTACRRYEPRKHLKTLAMARREILPSPERDKVGYFHVRRDKAALFPVGARPTRRFAPAGSNRGRHGGNDHQPILQSFERVLNTALRPPGRRRRVAEKGKDGG